MLGTVGVYCVRSHAWRSCRSSFWLTFWKSRLSLLHLLSAPLSWPPRAIAAAAVASPRSQGGSATCAGSSGACSSCKSAWRRLSATAISCARSSWQWRGTLGAVCRPPGRLCQEDAAMRRLRQQEANARRLRQEEATVRAPGSHRILAQHRSCRRTRLKNGLFSWKHRMQSAQCAGVSGGRGGPSSWTAGMGPCHPHAMSQRCLKQPLTPGGRCLARPMQLRRPLMLRQRQALRHARRRRRCGSEPIGTPR